MLTKSTWLLALVALFLAFVGFRERFYSSVPPSDHSGAPDGVGLCSDCHINLNNGGGSVIVSGLPTAYQPGRRYPFSVTINHPTARGRWGFEINARNALGDTVGKFSSDNPNTTIDSARTYAEITHFNAVSFNGTSYTYANMYWTAPSSFKAGNNQVLFYVAANAANADFSTGGDFIYTTVQAVPLPISLKKFEGKAVEDYRVRLDWTTASESNSLRFDVERSDNNRVFVNVGSVAASGRSADDRSYSFTDAKPSVFDQPIFYRLKLVDRDGKSSYSPTVAVTLKGKKEVLYSVAPNPAKDVLTASFYAPTQGAAFLRIVNAGGVTVRQQQVQLTKGANIVRLAVGNLPRGGYLLALHSREGQQSMQFTLQ